MTRHRGDGRRRVPCPRWRRRNRRAPLTPAWTEAHTDAGHKLTLETGLSGGVLLRVDGAPHSLQEDGTFVPVPAADAESPSALQHAPRIEGFWPKNAWRVSERELDDKALRKHDLPQEWGEMGLPPTWFRFHTFRGNNRWVGQTVGMHAGPDDYTVEEPGGVTEPDHDEYVVWAASPRRGLIVAKGAPPNDDEKTPLLHFERVGGGDAPESMEYQDGRPLGMYETKGGQVFLFLADFGHVVVQRSCAPSKDPAECAAQSRVALPAAEFGGSYELVAAAHRHRKSASFGLRAKHKESKETREFLLHYETGGFKLEVPPDAAPIQQILSADDGGLWIVLGNHLWHRDDAAQWSRVTLPPALADAAEIQIAKDQSDPRRLWISGGTQVVLTTPADLPAAN